jgi:hypothetical protein
MPKVKMGMLNPEREKQGLGQELPVLELGEDKAEFQSICEEDSTSQKVIFVPPSTNEE